jgi:hypothetical protein
MGCRPALRERRAPPEARQNMKWLKTSSGRVARLLGPLEGVLFGCAAYHVVGCY